MVVHNALKIQPETIAFLALVKQVFERHPTYWEGEPVEVDMEPEPVPEVFDTPNYLFRRVGGGDALVYNLSELSESDLSDLRAEISSVLQVRKTGKPAPGIYDPWLDAMFNVATETNSEDGCAKFSLLAELNDEQLTELADALNK